MRFFHNKVYSIFVLRCGFSLLIIDISSSSCESYLSLAVTAVMDIQFYLLGIGPFLDLGDSRTVE